MPIFTTLEKVIAFLSARNIPIDGMGQDELIYHVESITGRNVVILEAMP